MYQPATHPNKLIMLLISRASMVQIRVAIPYLVVSNGQDSWYKARTPQLLHAMLLSSEVVTGLAN